MFANHVRDLIQCHQTPGSPSREGCWSVASRIYGNTLHSCRDYVEFLKCHKLSMFLSLCRRNGELQGGRVFYLPHTHFLR